MDLDRRLLDAIVFSIGKTVTETFAQGSDLFVDEAGRHFLDYVREREGVRLVGDTPLRTINRVYAYFTERGLFTEAAAAERDGRIVIEERGPAHGAALRHMANDPGVRTPYCPACVLVRHVLRAHHNLAVADVRTSFRDPAAVVYDLALVPWAPTEPEAAFSYL